MVVPKSKVKRQSAKARRMNLIYANGTNWLGRWPTAFCFIGGWHHRFGMN